MISFVLIYTGSVKAIQAMNGAGWHDSFLGLWMAALRLVQRVWLFCVRGIFCQSLILFTSVCHLTIQRCNF